MRGDKREGAAMARTLGLDLGTNSVGWALIEEDGGRPTAIVATGVRIFQEAVDAKTRLPKNQQRRAARALRRILDRRRRRKQKLRAILLRAGLLPENLLKSATPETVFNELGDPYALRKRGLDHALRPHEFGRVLTALCARRGFQSNRKSLLGALAVEFEDLIDAAKHLGGISATDSTARQEIEKEEGIVLAAIQTLRDDMQRTAARTLGEYLADRPAGERRRGRFTDRAMFREEFDLLWERQREHITALADDGLRARVFDAIFFQRPLKSSKALVGRCSLEPSRRRAAVARLESQRFRLLQDVNHLAVRNPVTGLFRDLDTPERQALVGLLARQRTMGWGAARKALGLRKDELFNHEEGDRDELKGDTTSAALAGILGSTWEQMDPETRRALVEDLLTIADKAHLVRRLREHWRFPREQQYQLAVLELEPGYMAHSVKAINRMLPTLELGAKYFEAKQLAGYKLQETRKTSERLPPPPMVRNPVVQKALGETRKVLNALLQAYGKPDTIRIEMAREVRMSARQLAAFNKQQRANEKSNERALEQLASVGLAAPRRDDLIKYRLWEECGGECPYTGRAIGIHQLFSADVDVEHIIPYSRRPDDSYMNKTLCFADENRMVKRGQTPWEAYGADAARWGAILQRIRRLPPPKQHRFAMAEVATLDEFISRQLNDTRYVAVQVKNFVAALGSDIQVTKGLPTAMLRRYWDLNRILSQDPASKTRTDHLHHAVDAIVIACTNRSVYQRLASSAASSFEAVAGSRTDSAISPWPTFTEDVRRSLETVVVSHTPSRRLAGALHEETAYGYRPATGLYHYRKRLDALFSTKALDRIADPVIKKLVRDRLAEHGDDAKKAFSQPLFHSDGATPIRRVRLTKTANRASVVGVRNLAGEEYKFHDLGNNHHVEIFESADGTQRFGKVVSTLEAARRTRADAVPEVSREGGRGARFVMSLMINDMVEIIAPSGIDYYRVQKLSNDGTITLRHHRAATLDLNHERLLARPSTLKGRKVTVDPIGRVQNAGD